MKENKLYKIVYETYINEKRTTIIAARNEFQAIKKFHKMIKFFVASILYFDEYELGD